MTSELRPADSPWECFRDEAYYGMWCLRRENWRTFGQGFHLMRGEEAQALRDLLNEQAAELAKWKALADTLATELRECARALQSLHQMPGNGADGRLWQRIKEIKDSAHAAVDQYKEQRDAS